MRKILSFLALLVVGFAIPWHAGAWDYSKGPDTSDIKWMECWLGNSYNTGKAMTYSNSVWTSGSFKATTTRLEFKVKVANNANGNNYSEFAKNTGKSTVNDTWHEALNKEWPNSDWFYQEGMTVGNEYKIEISGGADVLKFRVVLVKDNSSTQTEKEYTIYLNNNTTEYTEPYCYIYKNGGSGKDDWAGVKMNAEANGIYSYNFKTTGDYDCVIFSDSSEGKNQTAGDGAVSLVNNKVYYLTDKTKNDKDHYKNVSYKDYDPNDYVPVVVTPWDFSSNGKPKALSAGFNSGASGSVTFSFSDGLWTSGEFKATGTEVKFYLTATDDKGKTQNICHSLGSSTVENWVSDSQIADGNVAYYQQGLTIGNRYKLEVKGDGDNQLQWRVIYVTPVDTAPDKLYMWCSNNGSWNSNKGNANYTDNKYTYTGIVLASGDQVTFTTSAASGWANFNSGSNKQYGNSSYPNVTSGTPVSIEQCAGGYNISDAGTYDIVFDWDAKTVTFTKQQTTTDVYIYHKTGSADSWNKGDKGTYADGMYSYTITLAEGEYFVFSTKTPSSGNTLSWSGMSSTRYCADGSNYPVNSTGNTTAKAGGNNAYVAGNEGQYKFRLDTTNGKLYIDEVPTTIVTPDPNAPTTLYLYSTTGPKQIGTATYADGKYVFNVRLGDGEHVVLSKNANASTWDGIQANEGRYNPTSDTDIPGSNIGFENANSGSWKATKLGNYTITVTWNPMQLSATCEEIAPLRRNLPLSSADFAGNKKHYFLVGDRMGEWHLQPEWEFTVNGNTIVLKDRFIYNGKLAVAMVDNYNDYIDHKYKYYSWKDGQTKQINKDNNEVYIDFKKEISPVKGEKNNTTILENSCCLYAYYDTGFSGSNSQSASDYYQGDGQYMSEITLSLDNNGAPSYIKFTPGSDEDAVKNRVFTLVGSGIYNLDYCNSSNTTKTPTFNEGGTSDNGWQEGWIQYNPQTNTPYVDGRNEYLYLTSFTPDYMRANPVRFYQLKPDGSDFTYSSNAVTFVEWSKLSNLENDSYVNFYQNAFDNNERIYNSQAQKGGEGQGFNFQLYTELGEQTPTGDWKCFVVRDMWIAGQMKFWTGWGGNQDYTEGGTGGMPVFHGPNGGPNSSKWENNVETGVPYQVKGYDINSGNKAVLYKNRKNLNNGNYIISSDNKPVYFNRVILWYNEADGVGGSFMQFIQENAGPAIFAQSTMNNTVNPAKKNFINYNWFLNVDESTMSEEELDRKVTAYSIRRYRVVDGVDNMIGYPEGEKISIADKNVKVRDLSESNASNYEFTKHLDTGIRANQGFTPGLYKYDIYVWYEGVSEPKYAASNEVPIYGDDEVTPDMVAYQIVELRDKYTDKYTKAEFIPSAEEKLKEYGYNQTLSHKYMTYDPSDDAPYYLFNIDANTNLPVDVVKIDNEIADDFLDNCPDQYWWTSNYYVRSLNYSDYAKQLRGYMDLGLIKGADIPEPTVQLTEEVEWTDEYGAEQKRSLNRGEAAYFKLDDGDEFYAMIVARKGNLADAVYNTKLTYKYTNADDQEITSTSNADVSIHPVIPRPFNPLYRYVEENHNHNIAETDENGENAKYTYGKILAPVNVPKPGQSDWSTDDHIAAGDMAEVYVKLDNTFPQRAMMLEIDFNRPNVDEEIFNYYDIRYDINMTNNDESTTDVYMNMDATLHDIKTNITNEEGSVTSSEDPFPNRYRIQFKGMHPRNSVYPTFSFVETTYVPNAASQVPQYDDEGNAISVPYVAEVANFGKNISFNAINNIKVNEGEGLKGVHLGWIQGKDGSYHWMYKGHEHLDDASEVIDNTKIPYHDDEFTEEEKHLIEPLYYLFEITDENGDIYTYPYLVPHTSDHRDLSKPVEKHDHFGWILNDSDPAIGAYIAKGLPTKSYPTLHATAMYIFERAVNINDQSDVEAAANFNELEVYSYEFKKNPNASKKNAPSRIRGEEDDWHKDLHNQGYGDLPDCDQLPDESEVRDLSVANETGHNAYIAVRGANYSYTPNNDTVTGVEDILAGYENDGEAVFYNLQGIQIDTPTTPGVYIRVQGKNATKVVIK